MIYNPLDLKSLPEFSTIVGTLVAQFTMTKFVITLKIKDLSTKELDAVIPNHANTIATLLMHMIAVEKQQQTLVFLHRKLNQKEQRLWKGVLPSQLTFINENGKDINYYLTLWDKVREFTIERLRSVDDKWLYLYPKGDLSHLGNNYYCLFHLMEDHLCHYGQIRGIIKILKSQT